MIDNAHAHAHAHADAHAVRAVRRLACLGLAAVWAVQAAAAVDPAVHDQIQHVLDLIADESLAQSDLAPLIGAEDIAAIQANAACDFSAVRHSEDGAMAIILFTCGSAGKATTAAVLASFKDGKLSALASAPFVSVPARP